MSVLVLIVVLVVLCAAIMGLRMLPPTSDPIRTFLVWAIVVIAVIVLLNAFGVIDYLRHMSVPSAR